MPVLDEMQIYNLALVLFSLIFDLIIIIFIIISVLLINSLLMIGVETKTLETGILRMVGNSKRGIILMIIIQCSMFVIPSLLIGLILCFPLLKIFYTYIFKSDASEGFDPVPSPAAIIFAIVVGFLVPFISSILPIMKVLS